MLVTFRCGRQGRRSVVTGLSTRGAFHVLLRKPDHRSADRSVIPGLWTGRSRGRLIDTVRARMALIILGSLLPILALGTVLIWQDYARLSEIPLRRGEATVRQIDQNLQHNVDRVAAMLEIISKSAPDTLTAKRLLLLAQSASGMHYCLLAVVDGTGHTVDGMSTSLTGGENCPKAGVPLTMDNSAARIWVYGGRPYLKVTVPAPGLAITTAGDVAFLVAVQPLDTSVVLADRHGPTAAGVAERIDAERVWLMAENGTPVAICPNCGWPAPPSSAIHHLQGLAASNGQNRASLQIGSDSYAYGPVAGVSAAIVEAVRLPQELTSLRMLGVWILMVAALLLAGLLGVMVAGHRLVLSPLSRLTNEVRQWERGGSFDASLGGRMPQEFRRLAWAFGTATRRLARRERELEAALERQREFVAEIHHRVKNNLQIVASLLNLQGSRVRNEDTRTEFMLARDRVRALATLHRHLNVEDEYENLRMESFLTELTTQLMRAASADVRARVTVEIHTSDIAMAPEHATPIALIVSEAVSNALKFAFPDGRQGRIVVSLNRKEDRTAVLVIRDNGVGLSSSRQSNGREGLGLHLIRAFARQMGGVLEIDEQDGTSYLIEFQVPVRKVGAGPLSLGSAMPDVESRPAT